MRFFIISVILHFIPVLSFAGIDNLLPVPQKILKNNQKFELKNVEILTPVLYEDFENFVKDAGGKAVNHSEHKIVVAIVDSINGVTLNKEEGYELSVTSKKININAITEKGVYWALQTLKQLVSGTANKKYIEGCEIIDFPAFRIRGFMQDVGRTYISLDELKREIAKLSEYKINIFHWHLTENQGWRLESKIFPMLNDSINYERMPGKFYTLEEAKDLVDFCKKHKVMLIPEIDMPGHSKMFTKTFRHDMQSPEGTKILKLLMDEVCDTFDVPYIHIGTDEVQFTNPDFVPEMVEFVRGKGKKVISWNPGWHYKPGEIDMTHLWSSRGKVQEGIPAIDSRLHYINHYDAFADIIALYNSRILNNEKGSDDIAGSILALWNDRYIEDENDIIKQNGVYPSMLALAERSWRGGGTEYFDKNGTVLPERNDSVFQAFENFEKRLLWHKKHNFADYPFAYVKQTNLNWKITDAFPNEGDLNAVFPPEKKLDDVYQYNGNEYKTHDARGAGVYLRHVWGNNIVKSFYENPQPNHTAYAYTYVYSPKSQDIGLWITFQDYSRSEQDLPPRQGKWDYKESKIWINDKEILAPAWQSQHTNHSNEIPLTNENFEVRDPIMVHLDKGWNKVLLKLPIGHFYSPEVRLVKWMFNCVFVNKDGQEAVDGLIYSPEKLAK